MHAYLLDIRAVNDMLVDGLEASAPDYREIACRWLQANRELWESWIPDKSKCFAQFGLFHELDKRFVKTRADPTHLTCRACPSGFFSKEWRASRKRCLEIKEKHHTPHLGQS